LQYCRYTQSCSTVVQSLSRRRDFVILATRVAINHGVNHQNQIGELQHTLRWRILKFVKSYFINRSCACSVWPSPRVHKFSQILGARTETCTTTLRGPRLLGTTVRDLVAVTRDSCTLQLAIVRFNPLKPELNPICYLLALLGAHHFLHVSRIRVKLLTLR